MHPKTSLVEGLLRYYDFINDVESHLLQSKVGKHLNKKSQTLLKQIHLGKQKLIFYLSYVKSGKFNFTAFSKEMDTLATEIKLKQKQ